MAGAACPIKGFPAVAIIEDDAERTRLPGRAARSLIDELLEAGDMVARLPRLVGQPFELVWMIEGEHHELVRLQPACRRPVNLVEHRIMPQSPTGAAGIEKMLELRPGRHGRCAAMARHDERTRGIAQAQGALERL